MATCLVVEHAPEEMSYAIGRSLTAAGVALRRCRVYAGDRVPSDAAGLDGIVVMGGPMSAASDDGFPTRRAEITLLSYALERGIPTLGVCLGSQLLAAAAGARVFPGDTGPEIGWAPIRLTPAADEDPLCAGLPPSWTVLHWHGDTFDLPDGAAHLASSERYANQLFRFGDRAWGMQFHLEVDRPAVLAFAAAFPDEAPEGVDGHATDAALLALEPVRALVCRRFAILVGQASDRRKQDVIGSLGNSLA